MARLALRIAVESECVTSEVIEVSEFPELAHRYAVRSVPKVVLSDGTELLGSLSESRLVSAVSGAGENRS